MLSRNIPGAQQIVVVGHGRSFLAAIVTGDVSESEVDGAIERVNQQLPHYKRIRGFHVRKEPFTIESGLLTAMGKIKRDPIATHLKSQIESLYRAGRA
jgi:long-subunit acyl-CoA synthetase (AMP-forming)